MSSRLIQNLIKLLEAEEAAGEGSKSTNYGTTGSFNNHGNGEQNFSRAKINSGAYSGDRNRYRTSNNFGDRTVNNSGTFNGHGNGGLYRW
ncbi:putative insoluble matrix shell protein 4-like [Sesbania bispinosa]|nr:putative insoluble matrix shell protein 4-like [Sesbania bispinosa]